MSALAETLGQIKAVAEDVGIAELAKEANVPLTTVRSFADRGWRHKNLDVVVKLAGAAERISACRAAEAAKAAA